MSSLAALNFKAAVELQVEMSSRRSEFRVGVIKERLQTKSCPPFVFANKVLLEHSHAHGLHIVCGCFHSQKTGLLSRYASDQMAHKA